MMRDNTYLKDDERAILDAVASKRHLTSDKRKRVEDILTSQLGVSKESIDLWLSPTEFSKLIVDNLLSGKEKPLTAEQTALVRLRPVFKTYIKYLEQQGVSFSIAKCSEVKLPRVYILTHDTATVEKIVLLLPSQVSVNTHRAHVTIVLNFLYCSLLYQTKTYKNRLEVVVKDIDISPQDSDSQVNVVSPFKGEGPLSAGVRVAVLNKDLGFAIIYNDNYILSTCKICNTKSADFLKQSHISLLLSTPFLYEALESGSIKVS